MSIHQKNMPGRVINYQAADYLHDLVMAPLGQPKRGDPRPLGGIFISGG